MISVRLYHGDVLEWLPHIKYFCSELSVYYFWDINDISVDEIKDKIDALGYGGLKTLYFKIPTLMDNGLTLLLTQVDC